MAAASALRQLNAANACVYVNLLGKRVVFRKCLFLVSYQEEMEDNHAVFFRKIQDNPRLINHSESVDLIHRLIAKIRT